MSLCSCVAFMSIFILLFCLRFFSSVDVCRPTNPMALLNTARAGLELSQMLVEVTTETGNHVVERARAWYACNLCTLPFLLHVSVTHQSIQFVHFS